MEYVVSSLSEPSLREVIMIIDTDLIRNGGPRCQTPSSSTCQRTKLQKTVPGPSQSDYSLSPKSMGLDDIAKIICRFIRHVKQHTALLRSPHPAQMRVIQELREFLVAHIAHNEDDVWFKEQQQQGSQAQPGRTHQEPPYLRLGSHDRSPTTRVVRTHLPSAASSVGAGLIACGPWTRNTSQGRCACTLPLSADGTMTMALRYEMARKEISTAFTFPSSMAKMKRA